MKRVGKRGSPTRMLAAVVVLWLAGAVLAQENVDPAGDGSQYAWGESIGWVNAEPQGEGGPGVRVTDTGLTGWIWAGDHGWISLSCQNTSSCGANNYLAMCGPSVADAEVSRPFRFLLQEFQPFSGVVSRKSRPRQPGGGRS